MAVVGDSNSTGHDDTLEKGVSDDLAWIAQVEGADVTFVGGWARDGATSHVMAENVTAVDDVDVLVIMAGTNNFGQNISDEEFETDLQSIASTIDPKYVVLAAIPPLNADTSYPARLNALLEKYAQSQKWFYHDGWVALRGTDLKWSPQYMVEGIHTTKRGYAVFGDSMKDYIVATFVGK